MGTDATPQMVCRGCGHELPADHPRPFRCPRADDLPAVDHVLVRRLDPVGAGLGGAFHDDEPNPFLRYRAGLFPHAWGRARGLAEEELVAQVRRLDAAVAAVDGRGFRVTPLTRCDELGRATGLGPGIELWLKDETGNVSGSHKGRHLMGVQLWLDTVRRLEAQGRSGAADGRSSASEGCALAIASCGNAALAASVVARAAGEVLHVFVPVDAEASVLGRLRDLGARVHPCPRETGVLGDPCLHAFHHALEAGMVPFGCQGSENGMTLEGGRTLGYEVVDELRRRGAVLDHLVVQVGGGALAASLILALRDARALGLLERLPRIHTVQTTGAHPLHRAWSLVAGRLLGAPSSARSGLEADLERATALAALPAEARTAALRHAATHRGAYMWSWESTPRSVATGILDDETYDWHLVVEAMVETGGAPVVAAESTLETAHREVPIRAGIPVCATGAAGLAGAMELAGAGAFAAGDRVGVVLSGRQR